jgi:hypothetical protein
MTETPKKPMPPKQPEPPQPIYRKNEKDKPSPKG